MSKELDEYIEAAVELVHGYTVDKQNLTHGNVTRRLTHWADGGGKTTPREVALAAFCLALLRIDGICEGRPVCVTDPCSRHCRSGSVAFEPWQRARKLAGAEGI